MSLLDRVRRTIREHDLARADTRVAVAVSGGSDSVALAHLVRDLEAAGELRAAGIVHFNHQLRPTAERDEHLAAQLAGAFEWPFVVEREDVRSRARRERRSIEDAARTARHEFFERARRELDAGAVALGHTRDDQAETFLLRLVRGAGPRGLAAMHPRNGAIVRPLIDCRRQELRAFLDEQRIAYADDETNEDVAIPRNRVRAELIPLLEARFNPRIADVLAHEAALAREEWAWMTGAADEVALAARTAKAGCAAPGILELDIPTLLEAPLALRRVVLWRAMSEAAGGRPVAFEHVEAALRLLEPGGGPAAVDAPGQRVKRIGTRVVLSSRLAAAARNRPDAAKAANLFHYPLSIPGEVRLAEAGCIVSVEPQPAGVGGGFASSSGDAAVAVVRSDVCQAPLAVRSRRPGDRFRPLGLRGRKKLQDFFVDRKVARQRRDVVPLVVDDRDRIVWVAGYAIDDQFRVTDPTQAVLILRLRQV